MHAALGAALQVADLSRETLRTRTGKDRDIDHLLVMRGRVSGARVLDCGLLSDHRPVTASVSSEG